MALGFLLTIGPLLGLSVIMTLVAVLWCVILMPRLKDGRDRFLVGLVSLISIHHGLRLLQQGGLMGPESQGMLDMASFLVTGLYALAVVMLEIYTKEYRRNRYRLRLAEGNEAPPLQPYRLQAIDMGAMREVSQAVADSSPLPMFAVDPQGDVCYWNSAAEKLFGWRKAEVMGRPLPPLAAADPATGESRQWLTNKDGRRFEAETWSAPMPVAGQSGTLTIVASHPTAA